MDAARAPHTAVVGLGWGDEGKGKIVDLLSPDFDVVVRFNGGANAGHTVCVGDQTFALHLVPAGVLHEGVSGLIGPGVALDPLGLLAEIDMLAARGVSVEGRLRISDRAHVVAPYHRIEDQLGEQSAGQTTRLGTTVRGIGPCYADKMRRRGAIRVVDLLNPASLQSKIESIVEQKQRTFQALYGQDGDLDAQAIHRQLADAAERLRPLVCDTTAFLQQTLDAGGRLLFEGANGALLDVDHGTYPFVTSSSTGTWGICAGAGVAPQTVSRYVGVVKAYATRVGAGPFPSELTDAIGDRIRDQGHEFGTTTGRPRRCGWFDAVATRRVVQLSGITEIALMHLDTLSGFEQIGICTAYRYQGQTLDSLPADADLLDQVEPMLEMLPGWTEELRATTDFADLPQPARQYVERLETLIGVPIALVSVGP
ncbi:MAG: adenylosuccinate synthase, partial [Planctomycetes bacterium]|nr:adenylosuccinate synthase [Planctomycetota bacterium]